MVSRSTHTVSCWSAIGSSLMLAFSSFAHAAPLSSAVPSVPSSPSSQSGAPTADKGPSTEMEALTAAQQGMLHAVSLHTSAPHSVVGVAHSLGSYTTIVNSDRFA